MTNKVELFNKIYIKKDITDIRVGDTVRVSQEIKEGDKEKNQVFEGLVIAIKHGREISSTVTVRRIISGIGVEKIFPLYSPTIEEIKILKRGKVKRAKLYYIRGAKGKRGKLKREEFTKVLSKETPIKETEVKQ